MDITRELFFVLLAALGGGLAVRIFKLQPLIGYILAGVIFGSILPTDIVTIEKLAEIGAILLLFSLGLELSFNKLRRIFKVAILGGVLQIVVSILLIFPLMVLLGFNTNAALILSWGFSLSSTAVVVKILADRGETATVHGEIMIGWLLVQDLAVIPMMVVLPALTSGGSFIAQSGLALLRALIVIVGVVGVGRIIAPFVIHKIAGTNSRELLIVAAVVLALGTAIFTSYFGISAALGAFLAGLVLSETQENHAVFSETRPLKDLFVALFFVVLGFIVKIPLIASNLGLIFAIVVIVMLIKIIVFMVLTLGFKYYGRTAIVTSLGLAGVGEFSFIIFSQAASLSILSYEVTSIGIAVAIISLLLTPFLFKFSYPLWRKLKELKNPKIRKYFRGGFKGGLEKEQMENHIIICGYGRVGKWVGKALESMKVKYLVIDYNQKTVEEAKRLGVTAIYGDPSQVETLEEANFSQAKAVVVAIPDRFAQEELITKIQTENPSVKIFSRAHFDEDIDRLKFLRVDRVVQPEFEAAVALVRSILYSMGLPKEKIAAKIRSLRHSYAARS